MAKPTFTDRRRRRKKSQSKRKRKGADLSEDLVVSILSRLPIKRLFKVQLVSKPWRALIHDHILRKSLPPSLMGFFYYTRDVRVSGKRVQKPQSFPIFHPLGSGESRRSIVDTSLSFLRRHPNLRIVDCCNGLLLCHSSGCLRHKSVQYYVCNPATKRWRALMLPPHLCRPYLYLAFDPLASPHFKVLCVKTCTGELSGFYRGELPGFHLAQIFSSETGRWGESMRLEGTHLFSVRDRQHGAFWSGALYVADGHQIIRFSLSGEQPRLIKFPDGAMKPGIGTSIGLLGADLCYTDLRGAWVRVWALGGCGRDVQWVLKHNATIKELEALRTEVGDRAHVLAFHPHQEVVFIMLRSRVLAYDFNSKALKEVCKLGPEGYEAHEATGFPFSPCLFDLLGDEDDATVANIHDSYFT